MKQDQMLVLGAIALAAVGGYLLLRGQTGGSCPAPQLAISLEAVGPGQVCSAASCSPPGGKASYCFQPGQTYQFRATPSGGGRFDHFEGPGVQTQQNPFSVQVNQAGFVRGVFA